MSSDKTLIGTPDPNIPPSEEVVQSMEKNLVNGVTDMLKDAAEE